MSERNLVAGSLGNVADLRKLVYPLLHCKLLLVARKQAEIAALAVVVVLVELENVKVERDCEFRVGPCGGEEESGQFGSVDFKDIAQRDDFSA